MAVKARLSNVELRGSGSVVDISSVPCHFSASKYHLLDQLFIPLLSLAQQANDVMGLRAGDEKTAFRAAAYLAGELLRDSSFATTRTLTTPCANSFWIDLGENRFEAETALQNTDATQFSVFCLKVAGAIRGDKFLVTEAGSNRSLFSFTRFEAEKPDFFLREFPFIASQARRDPSLFAEGQGAMLRGNVDLQITVAAGERMVTVRIRKAADSPVAEVKHPVTDVAFMTVPIATLGNIPKLMDGIAKHLILNPEVTKSLQDSAAVSP